MPFLVVPIAVPSFGLLRLAERIQLKVPRHDAVAACVDEQLVGGNALLVQTVDLAEDSLRIDNNTRADDVDALRIQDAGRNQLQLVLLTAGYNGVTGIVAAPGCGQPDPPCLRKYQ